MGVLPYSGGGLPMTAVGSALSNQAQRLESTLDSSPVKKAQDVYKKAIETAQTTPPPGDIVQNSVAAEYARLGNMPTIGQKVNKLIAVA